MVITACSHDDGNDPEPIPVPVTPEPIKDVTPPSIKVVHASVDITGVEQIVIRGNELLVGELLVASWTDEVTKSCKVQITFDGTAVSSGDVARKS